jgi:hypothetical protein
MVKTKVRKTPTLDAVRGVKSHIGELLSQIKQGQKWKRKYKKLKKRITQFEPKKVVVKDDVRKKRIYTIAISMLQTLGIHEMDLLFRMTEIAERAANCPELMSRHAKTIAAGALHACVKPELNKRFMQEKIGVSIPTIGQVSKIINLI